MTKPTRPDDSIAISKEAMQILQNAQRQIGEIQLVPPKQEWIGQAEPKN